MFNFKEANHSSWIQRHKGQSVMLRYSDAADGFLDK